MLFNNKICNAITLQVKRLQFLVDSILLDQNLKNIFISVLQAVHLRTSY